MVKMNAQSFEKSRLFLNFAVANFIRTHRELNMNKNIIIL